MADDKGSPGGRDRATAASEQDYEVAYFAKRHKITKEEAERLIQEHGNNRVALDQAASRRGAGGMGSGRLRAG